MHCNNNMCSQQPPLGFNPVVEALLHLNGLEEPALTYEQRVAFFLLEHSLDSAVPEQWPEYALARRIVDNIGDKGAAERRMQYVKACHQRYLLGIPVDVYGLKSVQKTWKLRSSNLLRNLPIGLINSKGEVNQQRLVELLPDEVHHEWPKAATGELMLDVDTVGRIDHEIALLLLEAKSLYKEQAITRFDVDSDGRHRSWPYPFGTKSGRDRPRGNSFVYLPKDYRYLIQPEPGKVVALIDYQQQEPAILAAFSDDDWLIDAYESGDLYEQICQEKAWRKLTRKQAKLLVISFLYGITTSGIVNNFHTSFEEAEAWLSALQQLFSRQQIWMDSYTEQAYLSGKVESRDWAMWVTADTPLLSLRNWPIQAAGADIIRRACLGLAKQHIDVVGCLHDAVLIETSVSDHQATIRIAEQIMQDASAEVLDGLRLKTTIEQLFWPPGNMPEQKKEWSM